MWGRAGFCRHLMNEELSSSQGYLRRKGGHWVSLHTGKERLIQESPWRAGSAGLRPGPEDMTSVLAG